MSFIEWCGLALSLAVFGWVVALFVWLWRTRSSATSGAARPRYRRNGGKG